MVEAGDIFERFAIMTVDGGLSDIEAMRELLKRWPAGGKAVAAWNIAIRRIGKMDDDARRLFERARESGIAMARL